MGRLKKHIQVAWLYGLQAIKMRLEYRADFAMECLAALLQQSAGLLMLVFLFNNIPALGAWSKAEVFFIYGFSLLPRALFRAFSMNFYLFSDKYIVHGEMDRLLLRPLSSLFQMMMEGIRFEFIADLTLGLGVLIYASQELGLQWTLERGLILALFVSSAWLVLIGVFLVFTSLSFWSQERVGLMPPIYNLLEFARYPLSIFHQHLVILLTLVIPFGFIAYYPSSVFLGKTEIVWLAWLTPLAGVICMLVGGLVWRRGLRHYEGAGS